MLCRHWDCGRFEQSRSDLETGALRVQCACGRTPPACAAQVKPEMFEEVLKAMGFEIAARLMTDGQVKGFDRPLLLVRKPDADLPAAAQGASAETRNNFLRTYLNAPKMPRTLLKRRRASTRIEGAEVAAAHMLVEPASGCRRGW